MGDAAGLQPRREVARRTDEAAAAWLDVLAPDQHVVTTGAAPADGDTGAPDDTSPLGRDDDETAPDAVHVASAGPTTPGAPHDDRVQGPRLLLERDDTQRGADHVYSGWRDPTSDFGLDVLAGHRDEHH